MTLRAFGLAVLLAFVASHAESRAAGRRARQPDVIFVPTPSDVVDAMLKLAKVTSNDVVYDLGSGDGRILIAAAKTYGAHGVGIDIDPERVREATANARDQRRRRQGDVPHRRSLHRGHQSGDGGHDLPVAGPINSRLAAEADEGAEAGHAHRVARVRPGRLEAAAANHCQRSADLFWTVPRPQRADH